MVNKSTAQSSIRRFLGLSFKESQKINAAMKAQSFCARISWMRIIDAPKQSLFSAKHSFPADDRFQWLYFADIRLGASQVIAIQNHQIGEFSGFE